MRFRTYLPCSKLPDTDPFWIDLQLFAEEKTEPATPRKREEARKKGQVPRSHDLTSGAALVAAILFLKAAGGRLMSTFAAMLRDTLGRLPAGDLTPGAVGQTLTHWVIESASALLPFAAGVGAIVVSVGLLQTGFNLNPGAVSPKLDKINPLQGLKRLFSRQSLMELLKAVLKLGVIVLLAWAGIRPAAVEFVPGYRRGLAANLSVTGGIFWGLAQQLAFALLVVGIADFAWQRFSFERQLRMTRQEIKDELKQTEGDPQIKGRLRERQRAIARQRMMADVPKADVVITNPTHYAVAIKFDESKAAAPIVVAKGMGYVAARIKEIARKYGVPLVEDRPLAQTLYKTVEVGRVIPPDLYQAVAVILAAVYRQKNRSVS